MLTLYTGLHIPAHVLFTVVGQDAVLLNTLTSKYYSLNEVGARFWSLLAEGKTFRETHQVLLVEFEVEASQLEQDLLELVGHLHENNLIETMKA